MSARKCCVDGCNSKREDVLLHRFPETEKRCRKWVVRIKSPDLKTYSKERLKSTRICHKHFEQKYIRPNSRLRVNAIPTLFTPEEISNGLPASSDGDSPSGNVSPVIRQHDHTYCNSYEPSPKRARLAGKSESTVRRIVSEGSKNKGKLSTPAKHRKGRPRKELDDFDQCAIRQKVHYFYSVKSLHLTKYLPW